MAEQALSNPKELLGHVQRNVFGGVATWGKIKEYLKGALENYGERAKAINEGYGQAYKSGKITPELINEALSFAPMGMEIKNVFHGSPYKFDKFADEKIGTGEGAQAFGYGHYLSDSPEVAEGYAKKLSDYGIVRINANTDPMGKYGYKYSETIKNHIDANHIYTKKDLISDLEHKSKQGFIDKDLIDWTKKADIKIGTESPYKYTATINKGKPSSADVFLEWDKPVDKINIQKIIEQAQKENLININENIMKSHRENTGKDIYNTISAKLVMKENIPFPDRRIETSNFLKRAGITGIKYPTGTLSGIKGSPQSNYVVFDPKNISIDKINDIPLMEHFKDYFEGKGTQQAINPKKLKQ